MTGDVMPVGVGGFNAGVGVWIRIVSGHGGLISDWGRG